MLMAHRDGLTGGRLDVGFHQIEGAGKEGADYPSDGPVEYAFQEVSLSGGTLG